MSRYRPPVGDNLATSNKRSLILILGTIPIITSVNEHEALYPNYYFCKNLKHWAEIAWGSSEDVPGLVEFYDTVAKELGIDRTKNDLSVISLEDNLCARAVRFSIVLFHVFCLLSHVNCHFSLFFFSELCWGKAMVTYTMPQQRKKEESEQLRGERDKIKFIDLRFERGQVVGLSESC